MKFLTYLCFTISATQLSVADHEKKKPFCAFPGIDIDVNKGQTRIPENFWWKGIPANYPDNQKYDYDFIEFKRNVWEDAPIWLDYTLQYSDPLFGWDSRWVNILHDSVPLCDTTKNTQGASIIALVRELLGMPEGCPVFSDERRDMRKIQFPLNNKTLFFNVDVGIAYLRIMTTMWSNSTGFDELLFTGQFNIVYPVTLYSLHYPYWKTLIH